MGEIALEPNFHHRGRIQFLRDGARQQKSPPNLPMPQQRTFGMSLFAHRSRSVSDFQLTADTTFTAVSPVSNFHQKHTTEQNLSTNTGVRRSSIAPLQLCH